MPPSTPHATAVPGLFVCTEFFSQDVENELYHNTYFYPHTLEKVGQICAESKAATGKVPPKIGVPQNAFEDAATGVFPDVATKLMNGIVESGLYPELLAPDYTICWSYPDKGSFAPHFDSRYRWGETVVGVTLGCGGYMTFVPHNKAIKSGPPPPGANYKASDGSGLETRVQFNKSGSSWAIHVTLPPRSVYVMSGACRTDWKHGVLQNNEARRSIGQQNPSLNNGVRRTMTFRCTKAFSDEVLKQALESRRRTSSSPGTTTTRLEERIKAQNKFRPQGGIAVKVSDQDLAALRIEAKLRVNVVNFGFQRLFFTAKERGYLVQNPGACCWPIEGSFSPTLTAASAFASHGAFGPTGHVGGGTAEAASLLSNPWSDIQQQRSPSAAASAGFSPATPRDTNRNNSMFTGTPNSLGSSASPLDMNQKPAALTKEEIRAKRLAALGMASSASVKRLKREPEPSSGKKAAKAETVDLLSDDSSEDENDTTDNKKGPLKRQMTVPSEVIEIDD